MHEIENRKKTFQIWMTSILDDFLKFPHDFRLIIDVESFDYAYFPRSARGFKIALNAATDKAVINQDGFYIRPGKKPKKGTNPTNLRFYSFYVL